MVTAPASTAPSGSHTARHDAALGAQNANLLGDLHALQMMGEHLARSLRPLFEPVLRRAVRLSADPIKVVPFGDYADGRGNGIAAHTLLAMTGLGNAPVLLVIDGALVVEAVDLFFGGTGANPVAPSSEFTPTCNAMIARLAGGIADCMAAAWGELVDTRFNVGRTEARAQMLSHAAPDDRMVLTRFQLVLGERRSTSIDILYPVAALKPIAPALCARVGGRKAAAADTPWHAALTRAVMDVRLPVRSVLAEPVIPLSRLLALKPGDIIPISFGPDVPLIVADNDFARGAVGTANGHVAVRVARIHNPEARDVQ